MFDAYGDNVNELEELYTNASSYAENFGYNTSVEWKDLTGEIEDIIEELSADLNDPQIEKLEQLQTLYIKRIGLEIDRMFFYAFKSGANLIMDIKTE